MAMNRYCLPLLAAALLGVVPHPAPAQKGDRIYCWVQNGRKTCGNVVPPEATNASRTVIDGRTGLPISSIDRVLTPEEQAASTEQRRQEARAEAAAAAARRRDMAMVMTYDTEADLMRAYDERTTVADDAIRSSLIGEKSMRTTLATLLDQANGLAGGGYTGGVAAVYRLDHVEVVGLDVVAPDGRRGARRGAVGPVARKRRRVRRGRLRRPGDGRRLGGTCSPT